MQRDQQQPQRGVSFFPPSQFPTADQGDPEPSRIENLEISAHALCGFRGLGHPREVHLYPPLLVQNSLDHSTQVSEKVFDQLGPKP